MQSQVVISVSSQLKEGVVMWNLRTCRGLSVFNVLSDLTARWPSSTTSPTGTIAVGQHDSTDDSENEESPTKGKKGKKRKNPDIKYTGSQDIQVTVTRLHGVMLAMGLSDGRVIVCDVQVEAVVRVFNTDSVVLAMTFSPDGRWLCVSSIDSCLRVWDVLSACLVDWVRYRSPIVGLAIDPTGTFMLTSHSGSDGGVSVWSNKFMFDLVLTAPLINGIPSKPIDIEDPSPGTGTAGGTGGDNKWPPVDEHGWTRGDITEDSSGDDCDNHDEDHMHSGGECHTDRVMDARIGRRGRIVSLNEPLEKGTMTLSGLSYDRINAIIHHSAIKERNRPLQAAAKIDSAPFFLKTKLDEESNIVFADEADPEMDVEAGGGGLSGVGESREMIGEAAVDFFGGKADRSTEVRERRTLQTKTQKFLREKSYEELLLFLKGLSPGGVHSELTQLGALSGGDDMELRRMMEWITLLVTKRVEADFVQALLQVFLQLHAASLLELVEASNDDDGDFESQLDELERLLRADWTMLETTMEPVACHLKTFTHVRI
eukprot:GHVN01059789.1.p3 GENE.GHVN01059789.1~~GHVN01059789.1.p3  ORF type:complete len:542 (-),score=106.92 GHVN01059789.1:82-1707(-)